MITKEKFQAYEDVRNGGRTNMFDVKKVIVLSGGELTREDCLDIMKSYDGYCKKYPDVRTL
jgi:hypothetical protein